MPYKKFALNGSVFNVIGGIIGVLGFLGGLIAGFYAGNVTSSLYRSSSFSLQAMLAVMLPIWIATAVFAGAALTTVILFKKKKV